MKTRISHDNPFPRNAKAHLWEHLKNNISNLHLDFGANDGNVLHKLYNSGVIKKGVGLDANEELVEKFNYSNRSNDIYLQSIKVNKDIPFADNYFESTSLFGVLEHVSNQKKLLNELHRVTKENGIFLIAVPGKHLFSFLDMGNWKFIFPRAHKLIYSLYHGSDLYKKRYIDNQFGLIGDIEIEKSWHQHFSKKELLKILETNGFIDIKIDGFGFFHRLFMNIRFFLPGKIKKILDPLIELDKILFSHAEIWGIARVKKN